MVGRSLLLVILIANFTSIWSMDNTLPNKVDLVKKKWMEKADSYVESEKIKFLSLYGLTLDHLNNQEAIEGIKSSHDQMVSESIANLDKSQLVDPLNEIIQNIATKIVRKYEVKTVNENKFEIDEIGVTKTYTTNVCYISLNVSKWVENLQQIEAILHHEYCHIVYEDNFNTELLRCIAWVHSNDEHEEVKEKSYPFCKAKEIRADIYAAVNSLDHGKTYIAALKLLSQNNNISSERLEWLEQIKCELDTASE